MGYIRSELSISFGQLPTPTCPMPGDGAGGVNGLLQDCNSCEAPWCGARSEGGSRDTLHRVERQKEGFLDPCSQPHPPDLRLCIHAPRDACVGFDHHAPIAEASDSTMPRLCERTMCREDYEGSAVAQWPSTCIALI